MVRVVLALCIVAMLAAAVWLKATGPSLRMRIVKAHARATYDPMPDPQSARKSYAARTYPAPAPLPESMRERYQVREARVHGEPVFTLAPRVSPSGWHIL